MATYGTPTTLASTANLHSLADTNAKAFGEIQLSGDAESVRITIPINSGATGGTYDIYLVQSEDGSTWTDGIDPALSSEISAKISDAILLESVDTTYNGTNRTDAVFHFNLAALSVAEYIGFVCVNNSGQTTPSSGASGTSTTITL